MPTYEYQCKSCGTHHEVVQKFGDDPLTECPSCGGPLRKVFGAVGVVFKGSGFYKTDSRSSAKKADRSDKSEKSDSPEKADKPAATSGKEAASSESSGPKSSDSGSKPGAATPSGQAAAAS
jgi:putative FmdB family regulatory protein